MNIKLTQAIERLKSGKFIIVTDDESRENEGDLIALAPGATGENLAFMIRHTSGVVCVAITAERARNLNLPPMFRANQDSKGTAFTVSIDSKRELTTGISAQERANTIQDLANQKFGLTDFIRPGHIFPLVVRAGGLRERRGHTEAAMELAVLAQESPVGVIAELVNDDGTMMRGDALINFSQEFDIPILTIDDIASDSIFAEKLSIPELIWAELPTHYGSWKIASFSGHDGSDHLILKFGNPMGNAIVRIHSECVTGDALGSLRCDCGLQLTFAMERISESGAGYILYLRNHEGRGIGIAEKIKAYALQDKGLDTVEANIALGHLADLRDFQDASAILNYLKISEVVLLTNNPEKAAALELSGIDVEIETTSINLNPFNEKYVRTKRSKLHHLNPDKIR